MFGLGVTEIMVILVVALLFIGPEKLPDVARTLGKGLRELRKATDDIKDTVHGTVNTAVREVTRPESPVPPSPPFPGSGAAPPATEPSSALSHAPPAEAVGSDAAVVPAADVAKVVADPPAKA